MNKQIKAGKRYWFYINNYEDKVKSGLFTGKYNSNGSAIIVEKTGAIWAIPENDLYVSNPKHGIKRSHYVSRIN